MKRQQNAKQNQIGNIVILGLFKSINVLIVKQFYFNTLKHYLQLLEGNSKKRVLICPLVADPESPLHKVPRVQIVDLTEDLPNFTIQFGTDDGNFYNLNISTVNNCLRNKLHF